MTRLEQFKALTSAENKAWRALMQDAHQRTAWGAAADAVRAFREKHGLVGLSDRAVFATLQRGTDG